MSTTLRAHLRSYTPVSEPQNEVVASARTLESTGKVDDCEIIKWPSSVPLTEDTHAVRVHEKVTDWAEETDIDVDRPFRIHERTNPVTGETEVVLHTPVVYVTLEADDELVGVAPCTLPDGTHVSAKDYLASLAKNDDPFDPRNIEPLTA